MPKKFTYIVKELGELFNEQLAINYPTASDLAKKHRFLTDVERTSLWIDILNRYGQEGWKLAGTAPLMVGEESHFTFMKEVYARDKE